MKGEDLRKLQDTRALRPVHLEMLRMAVQRFEFHHGNLSAICFMSIN